MLFQSKIFLPLKTLKTGGFLRRLLQHNGRVLASYASCQGSSLSQIMIFFFNQVFSCCYRKHKVCCKSKLAPSMLFLSKIIPLPAKTPKTAGFQKKTPVAQWQSTGFLCKLSGFKSGYFFSIRVLCCCYMKQMVCCK